MALKEGESCQLQIEGNYQPVIFESGKPAIAFVDENGMVCARGQGNATLSGKVNGQKITIAVKVTKD